MTIHVPTLAAVTSGDPGTAAWADNVKIYLDFLKNPPNCFIARNVAGNLASGTTLVANTLDTAIDDDYGMFDGTHPTRITPNIAVPCRLRVHAFCRFSVNDIGAVDRSASGGRAIQMTVTDVSNVTTVLMTDWKPPLSGQQSMVDWDREVDYAPGDYYTMLVAQNSGGTLTLSTGYANGVQISWVGTR